MICVRIGMWPNSSQWDIFEERLLWCLGFQRKKQEAVFLSPERAVSYCNDRNCYHHLATRSPGHPWNATPGAYLWSVCLWFADKSTPKWYTNFPTFQEMWEIPCFVIQFLKSWPLIFNIVQQSPFWLRWHKTEHIAEWRWAFLFHSWPCLPP